MRDHQALARALWEADNSDMTPEWREMAWNDMGGSEPTQERAECEVKAARILADPTGLLEALVKAGVLDRLDYPDFIRYVRDETRTDDAVAAVAEVIWTALRETGIGLDDLALARAAVEVARPHLAAQALREAADALHDPTCEGCGPMASNERVADWLRDRADRRIEDLRPECRAMPTPEPAQVPAEET